MPGKEGKNGKYRDIASLKDEFYKIVKEFKEQHKLSNYYLIDFVLKEEKEFGELINDFKRRHDLSQYDIIDLIVKEDEIKERADAIPAYIFDNDALGCFEAIVKFLRERVCLSNKKIALMLDRDQSTVAVTYLRARRKMPQSFIPKETDFFIPISSIKNRKMSVLETIVSHLKENYRLTYHNIALLLHRDDRTVWTVYQRALKKRKNDKSR